MLQRTAKELEHLQLAQQVQQAAADSAKLMAPVARRKVRKEIEKVCLQSQTLSPCCAEVANQSTMLLSAPASHPLQTGNGQYGEFGAFHPARDQ